MISKLWFVCIVVLQDVLFFEILTFSFAKLFVKPVFSWIETSGDQTKLNQTPQDQSPQDQSPQTNHEADPNTLDVSNDSKQSQDLEAPVTAETNASLKAEAVAGPEGKFLIFYFDKFSTLFSKKPSNIMVWHFFALLYFKMFYFLKF